MKPRLTGAVLLSGLAVLISSCTALPGGAKVDPRVAPEGTVAFQGLLSANGAVPSTSPVRYIFMVHGMGDTRDTYSEALFKRLKDQGYTRSEGQDWTRTTLPNPVTVQAEAYLCEGVAGPPCRFTTFGRYRTDTFAKDGQKVVVYTYYWHEDLNTIQAPFMAQDLEEKRSVFMRGLKRDIIVMGFGDAAAYLGPGSELVRNGIAVGLCAMLRQAAGRPVTPEAGGVACNLNDLTALDAAAFGQAEYGFVTMSLGSRMLFDTLEINAAQSETVLPVLSRRTRYFYMLANQLPLLGLGQIRVTEQTDGQLADTGIQIPIAGPSVCADEVGILARIGCERADATHDLADSLAPPPVTDALDIVAFHDPEDLLGFGAGKGMAQSRPGLRFVEVWNRNAPVYLGLAADPRKTHAEELEHDTSARLILCGARAGRDGKLEPLVCD